MVKLSGKAVYKGVVIGPVAVLKKDDQKVKRTKITDVDAELARLKQAGEQAAEQLQRLYDKAVKEVGEASAAIFEVHQMMLEDDDYLDAIHNMIQTEMVNAEYAVAVTGDNFSEMFANMDDDYMKARAADVKDISNRLVRNLMGQEDVDLASMEPSIIVADDLSPSETVQMDKSKILAFVTVHGSTNSHTAILARMMNIPALIGIPMNLDEIHTGMKAVVDGFKGEVIFEPSEEICAEVEEKIREEQEKLRLLQTLKGKENVTPSGQKINIYANIGSVSDVGYVLENDAGGIGLFRSEFLYLDSPDFPSEEKQFAAYRRVLEIFAPNPVVVRTLDLGSDKQAPYFNIPDEENPAMGYRAIRICLDRPEIFRTQLRALIRASVYGKLDIMFPMITSVGQVRRIKEIVEECKAELKTEGIPFADDIELGVMIETPAAAIMSDEIAKEVDFFSIGTNDLTQYTMAADRMNVRVNNIFNSEDPAILRLIEITARNAHAAGIWVGVCGEAGANTRLTSFFMKNKLDELSVAATSILKVRKAICESEE